MRCFLPLLGALALALSGCGGHHKQTTPPPVQAINGHHCSPTDFAMGCVRPKATTPRTAPLVGTTFAQGVDFAWGGPSVAWMQSVGAKFGASYLSYDLSKNWSHSLVGAYHQAGIATVFVWETTSTRCLDGFSAGASDAHAALSQAQTYGLPTDSRPIYFACDTDTTGQAGRIDGYYRGVTSVIPPSRVGDYGGYDTIAYVHSHGLAAYGWMAGAWDYGRGWLPYAQLEQYGYGDTLDWNRAVAVDYGQWPSPARVHCFGPNRARTHECAVIRANVARWGHAVTATRAALAHSHCWQYRPHARAPQPCRSLFSRGDWFHAQIRRYLF